MSPSLAERWAETFGWKPLARWAEPSLFDPMHEDEWSLSMVAAWVRFRDFDEVRSRWSVYLEASPEWVDIDVDGENRRYSLEAGVDHGYFELPHERTETKLDLLKALRSGRLTAKGLRDGRFVEIPAIEWTALRVVGAQGRDGIYKVMTADGSSQAYEEVRIQREHVLAAFPLAAPAWEAARRGQIGMNKIDSTHAALKGLCDSAAVRVAMVVNEAIDQGHLRRADIVRVGKVTQQQAAVDLREIRKRFPDLLDYDPSSRRYFLLKEAVEPTWLDVSGVRYAPRR